MNFGGILDENVKPDRPAHETLAEAIRRARSNDHWEVVQMLIGSTKIPKGHDEILAAIDSRRSCCYGFWAREICAMRLIVLNQKREAEEKAAAEFQETTYGELKVGDFYLNSKGARKRKVQLDLQVCSVAVEADYAAFASCPPDSQPVRKIVSKS